MHGQKNIKLPHIDVFRPSEALVAVQNTFPASIQANTGHNTLFLAHGKYL
jgi:hypothetical protein